MGTIQGGVGDALPVSPEQYTAHFSSEGMDETELARIASYVAAATAEIEMSAGICLITRDVTVTLDRWPNKAVAEEFEEGFFERPIVRNYELSTVDLPLGPVLSASTFAVTAIDGDGGEIDIAPTNFRMEPGLYPTLKTKASSTAIQEADTAGGVSIQYEAGYGPDHSTVPADLRLAICEHALRLYENRGDDAEAVGLQGTAARVVAKYRRIRL